MGVRRAWYVKLSENSETLAARRAKSAGSVGFGCAAAFAKHAATNTAAATTAATTTTATATATTATTAAPSLRTRRLVIIVIAHNHEAVVINLSA